MTEFKSRWLAKPPDAAGHGTDSTDRRAIVSTVSASPAGISPDSLQPDYSVWGLDALNARLREIYDSPDPHSDEAREERHLICAEIYRRSAMRTERL